MSFEGSAGEETFPRLGLTLAPAHHALDARRAVGLPPVTGLLVRDVARGSRAEHAGIRPGDVLTHAAGAELRSITTLYAAISEATRRHPDHRHHPRREAPVQATLDLHPQQGDDHPPGNTAPSAAAPAHTL